MRPGQDREERHQLLTRLLLPERGWVNICRAAVREGDVAALAQRTPYWDAFAAERRHLRPSATGIEPVTATTTARAVLGLARALSDDRFTEESVRLALDVFNQCGLTSPSASHEPFALPTETPLDRVLSEIELLRPGNPSADFTVLLARRLAGQDIKIVRKVEMPVLFDQTTAGSVGYLIVSETADGPAGLHPDPQSMSFLAADDSFQRAIANAWALVPENTTKRSFIWEIRDAATGQPVQQVAGDSLGLAWFVALDSFRLGKALTLLRLKKLDPLCAVTGRIEHARPASVEGYENKFKAAEGRGLRIVYPAIDRETAEPIATRLAATATPADDLASTVRAVRNRPNPTARIIIFALAAAFVGMLVTGAALAGQVQRAGVAADVQSLINKSQAQLAADPRKAALYALAANKLGSSVATRENVFNVAAENPNIVATLPVADQAIRLIRTDSLGRGLYVVAGDNNILRIDNDGKVESWRFQADSRVKDLAVSPDGTTLVVLDDHTIKTYDLTSGTPSLSKVILQDVAQLREQLRVYVVAASKTSLSTHNVLLISNKSATVFSGSGRTLGRIPLTGEDDENVTTAGNDLAYESGGSTVTLASSKGRVLDLRTEPLAVSTVAPQGALSGTIYSVEALPGTQILAGTSKGLYSVDYVTKTATTVPSVGVSDAQSIALTANNLAFDGGLAIIGSDGLTVAPVFDGSTLSFTLTRTGDRHLTSMAMSGGYLAVGDVGGRITYIRPGPKRTGQGTNGTRASAAAFSPDGSLFTADASRSPMAVTTIERTKSANSVASQPTSEPDTYRITRGADPIYVNNLDAGAEYLAAAGQSGSDRKRQGVLVLWKRDQQEPVQIIDFSGENSAAPFDTPDIVTQVKLIEDKNLLLAYNIRSGTVRSFRLPDMTPIASKSIGSANRAFAVTQNEASLLLLSGTSFSSDGRDITLQMLSTTDFSVRWSMAAPNAAAATPLAGRNSIAVLEDPQTMVIRSESDGSELQSIKLAAPTRDIVASPDGKLLAAIQQDGTVKILSTSDFIPAAPPMFDQHRGATVTGAWAPDGQTFVGLGLKKSSAGKPQAPTYALWDLSSNTWENYLCAVAGSDLTAGEWASLQLSSPRPALCHNQD
ncbi:WD40 repeat domain-containing protein [Arthrobacter globiformis]|uniref:WD40 repeat domain-containing protein n=1 Tax=Arthrobacter globiformis TaxID=1665 RepID=UPI00278CC226|nr:WD40 repeat domain-containing protein [Arthrobacter globiformis]MDQ0618251.1 WD40 repeat protein [Arthrobacter globiformis]